ncbi:MAG: PilZ domain-containing protein [Treponema sp.]|nr:PilZ domain-containing protein [Treponema sp.]
MLGNFTGLSLFLLQWRISPDSFARQDNNRDAMMFAIGIGAIVVIGIIFSIINKTRGGTSGSGGSRRRFGYFALLRIKRMYGLNKDQTKLLEHIFKLNAVGDPDQVLVSPATLDRFFKRAYKQIEESSMTDDESQHRMLRLFSLRNILEATPSSGSVTPGNLSADTPAILAIEKDSYSVKVLSSRGQNITTSMPRTPLGTPIRIPKGTKMSLSFFTRSSSGFSFDGNIIGTINTDFGPGLQITHNRRPKPLIKRKFRRREINERCEFFFVNLVETGRGRRKTSKLVVGNKRLMGNILDISVGGCSMKISTQIPAASRLKINMDYEDTTISILGQVIRSNRSGYGIIIHVKFLKVPRRAFNAINSLVFGFDEN